MLVTPLPVERMIMPIEPIASQVQQLHDTFSSGKTRPMEWRVTQLSQIKNMLAEQESRFQDALKNDLNKGDFEAWTSEIGFTIGDVDHTLAHLKAWMKPRKVSTPMFAQPGKSFSLPEPLGTVLIIGAWNYPIQLVLGPLTAAFAAESPESPTALPK